MNSRPPSFPNRAPRRRHPIAVAGLLLNLPWVPPAAGADAVIEWNEAALRAIRDTRENPPRASRALAITHLAIHDAVNGVLRTHRPYHVAPAAPAGASIEAAVAASAHTALHALFTSPDVRQTNFLALHTAQLAAIPDGPAKSDGLAWGQSVAEAILALRANDGWNVATSYAPSGIPGRWQPTPPAFAPALLPGWGQVTPFSMTHGAQFRPQPPPGTETVAYAFEFHLVRAYGGATSTVRSADQTEVAWFWNDGAGTVTPPGHWNRIAQEVSAARSVTLADNARLFALLNLANADAAISCWDAKFAYDLWRPLTAIREADDDANADTGPDPEWLSLIPTPPFPEYTSGHSTFSRGSATVLAGFFGTDAIPFSIGSEGTPGVQRSYTGFDAAANEAGISRIFGGIHWNFANQQAQAAGFRLGHQILSHLLQPMSALQFTHIAHAGGVTRIEARVEPGRSYAIRASSDLNTWETLAVASSEDGVLAFTDPNAAPGRLRFYVVAEP